jgi:tetratricopeptide (TPR) repeat protein
MRSMPAIDLVLDPAVEEVLAAVNGAGGLIDVEGWRGSGRTRVIERLADRLQADHSVVRVDLLDYESLEGDAALGEFAVLVDDLASQLPWATGVGDEPESGLANVQANALAKRFAAALTEPPQPVVLLVDNASAATGELEKWFDRLLGHVVNRRATIVLTRDAAVREPRWLRRATAKTKLPRLTTEQVRDVFGKACERLDMDEVMRWSAGYPPAVDAAYETLVVDCEVDLERPRSSLLERLRPAIDFRGSVAPEMRIAVDVAASLRCFDFDTIAHIVELLREHNPDYALPDRMMARLGALPFVTRDDEDRLAFHGFFRALVADDLRTARRGDEDLSAYEQIHRAATRHFGARLNELVEESRWGGLEGDEWNSLAQEFVYHATRFAETPWARLQIAKIYFDVIWWWGSYLKDPRTAELLEVRDGFPQNDEFAAALRDFDAAHVSSGDLWPLELWPNAFRDDTAPEELAARWEQARGAVLAVRELLELDDDEDSPRDEREHVRAVTAAFLGDALRRLDPQDREADQRYDEARRAFGGVKKDGWCVPWVEFYKADLLLERGDFDGAAELARRALSSCLEDDETDYEVIANCHRVLGDGHFRDGDFDDAFREYARAVFAAYAFHADDLPDTYTRMFHQEHAWRAIWRLRELAQSDPRAARDVCEIVLRECDLTGARGDDVERLLAEQAWDELRTTLFPREPHPNELEEESAYLARARRVRDDRRAELLARV